MNDRHIPLYSQKKYKETEIPQERQFHTDQQALITDTFKYVACVPLCLLSYRGRSSRKEPGHHLVYFMEAKTGKRDSNPFYLLV